ncbi:tumor necrosis factor receptor superfamily member 13B [Arapaima gigas]
MDCTAVPGQFYDQLLNSCLRCVDVCGQHPLECAHVCHGDLTRAAADPPAGHIPAIGVRTHPGGGFHTVVIYSLLGLCLIMLVCTLTLAVLVLRQKTKSWRKAADHCGGDPNGHENQGSSKGLLIPPPPVHRPLEEKLSQPSETCIHCFPELRVSGQGGDRQPLPPSTPTVYQQAAVAGPSGRLASKGPFHPAEGKDGVLRIICSPSQSSS